MTNEKNIPLVRLLDETGEGIWIATEQITAIGLTTIGEGENPQPLSKVLLASGVAMQVQGTPDEIVQYLAGVSQEDVDDTDATLEVDETYDR